MPYVAVNWLANTKAPLGKWVCTRTSADGPYSATPPTDKQNGPNFCGQCVSFVTTVCPTIPVNTGMWKQGALVKGNTKIQPGTAIATFNSAGKYYGHTAIYEHQTTTGINVVDQWVTPPATAIHKRMLQFGAHELANNGDNFYIVD